MLGSLLADFLRFIKFLDLQEKVSYWFDQYLSICSLRIRTIIAVICAVLMRIWAELCTEQLYLDRNTVEHRSFNGCSEPSLPLTVCLTPLN